MQENATKGAANAEQEFEQIGKQAVPSGIGNEIPHQLKLLEVQIHRGP